MFSHLHQFSDNGKLCTRLASWIVADLTAAIAKRGSATLAVSGGTTPKPLFERLSHADLDWSKVTITQVDERWVDEDHPDANARLIREHLLRDAAAAACFVSMKTDHPNPFEAEAAAAQKLAAFTDGIDVVVLGMGEDGHTASFFPGAQTLKEALDPDGDALCVAISPPVAPHDRMTLSLAALLRASNIYLHVTGETKWKVLRRAGEPGEVRELPVRSVLFKSGPPVEIFYSRRN
jgi:6-phosphogluconolactonase